MHTEFIVLDTESTGLDTRNDRIVEIGCVKIHNNQIVDQYQQYINPMCEVSPEATKVHGLTYDFLTKYPKFQDIAESFLTFIGNTTIVAHNAKFDITIINSELTRCSLQKLNNNFLDTLYIARKKFPGSPANLDALCIKLGIVTNRPLHGALLDAQILTDVFIALNKIKISKTLSFAKPIYDWSKRIPRYEVLTKQ